RAAALNIEGPAPVASLPGRSKRANNDQRSPGSHGALAPGRAEAAGIVAERRLRRGATTRVRGGRGAEREAGSAPIGGVEVVPVTAGAVAEPGDAAPDHALWDVGQRPARTIDQLEIPRRGMPLEARKLGIGVELLHLAVDVGFDSRQQLDGRLHAVDEDGVEHGERPEEVRAVASQDLAGWHPRHLADARDQRQQLLFRVAPEGTVHVLPELARGGRQLALDEVGEVGEEDPFHGCGRGCGCVTVRSSARRQPGRSTIHSSPRRSSTSRTPFTTISPWSGVESGTATGTCPASGENQRSVPVAGTCVPKSTGWFRRGVPISWSSRISPSLISAPRSKRMTTTVGWIMTTVKRNGAARGVMVSSPSMTVPSAMASG